MQNSKTLSLLKSLDTKELRQFSQFIRSPFSMKSQDALALYRYLIKYAPDFSSPNLDKEIIFKKLFPKEKYSDIKLRNLMRKITKVLEEYLILLEFRGDEKLKKRQLKTIYGKRNLYPYFDKATYQILAENQKLPFRDSEYFFEEYSFLKDWYFHPNTLKDSKNVKQLEKGTKAFFQFVEMEKLRLKCEFKNRERIFGEVNKWEGIESELVENITAKLFKKTIQLIDSQNEKTFEDAKRLLFKNRHLIGKKDAQIIFLILINYAIQQSAKEEIKYLKNIFDLYKIGAKEEYLIFKNRLDGITFINISVVGAKLKEFQWTQKFIEEYKVFIKEKQENYFNLAYSFIDFHRQAYKSVIDRIYNFDFEERLLTISAKTLLVRTYFELFLQDSSNFNFLNSTINSFEKYLTRHKLISPKKAESYLNFLKYNRKLAKGLEQNDRKAISRLKRQLEKEENIISKTWMLKKMEGYN